MKLWFFYQTESAKFFLTTHTIHVLSTYNTHNTFVDNKRMTALSFLQEGDKHMIAASDPLVMLLHPKTQWPCYSNCVAVAILLHHGDDFWRSPSLSCSDRSYQIIYLVLAHWIAREKDPLLNMQIFLWGAVCVCVCACAVRSPHAQLLPQCSNASLQQWFISISACTLNILHL